jgi:hypothetical protein
MIHYLMFKIPCFLFIIHSQNSSENLITKFIPSPTCKPANLLFVGVITNKPLLQQSTNLGFINPRQINLISVDVITNKPIPSSTYKPESH